MPIVDASDPAVWEHNWHGNKRGVHLQGYSRALCFQGAGYAAQRIITSLIPLGLSSGQNILLVGCGLGWTAEWLARDWPNERAPMFPTPISGLNIVGLDNSPLIQSWVTQTDKQLRHQYMLLQGKDPDGADAAELNEIDAVSDGGPQARITIYDYDLSTGKGRADARKLIGNAKYDWGITDNVLPWLTDNEVTALTGWGEQCCDAVAHLVTPFLPNQGSPEPEPVWNWKPVSEWKTLLPSSTIISLPTNEVA